MVNHTTHLQLGKYHIKNPKTQLPEMNTGYTVYALVTSVLSNALDYCSDLVILDVILVMYRYKT